MGEPQVGQVLCAEDMLDASASLQYAGRFGWKLPAQGLQQMGQLLLHILGT